jgi:hypothetical protein
MHVARKFGAIVSSLLVLSLAVGSQADGDMVALPGGTPHIAGGTNRTIRGYDETGQASWQTPIGRFAQSYFNYWGFWNRDRGVPVPYLDYRQSGGAPGCGNQAAGEFDICLGDPGAGNGGVIRYRYDTGTDHLLGGTHIILRNSYTDRQRESLGCQEISHVFGLGHNSHTSAAATESCMYPDTVSNPGVFYDSHDDSTLRTFYSGHQP